MSENSFYSFVQNTMSEVLLNNRNIREYETLLKFKGKELPNFRTYFLDLVKLNELYQTYKADNTEGNRLAFKQQCLKCNLSVNWANSLEDNNEKVNLTEIDPDDELSLKHQLNITLKQIELYKDELEEAQTQNAKLINERGRYSGSNKLVFLLIVLSVIIGGILFLLPKVDKKENEIAEKPTKVENKEYTIAGRTYMYTGEVLNDLPHGWGRAEYKDDNVAKSYIGTFKEGYLHGYGKLLYNDKYKKESDLISYDGGFYKNELDGCGILLLIDKSKIYTEYSQGKLLRLLEPQEI